MNKIIRLISYPIETYWHGLISLYRSGFVRLLLLIILIKTDKWSDVPLNLFEGYLTICLMWLGLVYLNSFLKEINKLEAAAETEQWKRFYAEGKRLYAEEQRNRQRFLLENQACGVLGIPVGSSMPEAKKA